MSFRTFPNITPGEAWSRITGAILQYVRNGKLNCVEEITLTASSATTTLTDQLIGPGSHIGLMSMHADAAAELPTLSFDNPGYGSVVINHSNNILTTRRYRYTVIG